VADYVIEAQPRTVVGKQVKQLRSKGMVPAVVYGAKIEPVAIQIPYRPLEVTLMHAGGTQLIDIQVGGQIHTVLTRDVQRHVIKGNILHVDFFAVDVTQVITADVFIQFTGESPAVESGQGMLLTGTNNLAVETLPGNIPEHITVDLSGLAELGDSIHVRDIDLGEGVTILNDPEELIVRVVQPSAARAEAMEEEEAEVGEGEAAAAEEVEDSGDEGE
jgi:large subunit ribosomal protein L25